MSNLDRYPDDYPEWKDHPDSPEAPRPVPEPTELSDREKMLAIMSYVSGYQCGHNDTVESAYADPDDSAEDWLPEALIDGTFEELI